MVKNTMDIKNFIPPITVCLICNKYLPYEKEEEIMYDNCVKWLCNDNVCPYENKQREEQEKLKVKK
jgi:hypothetical protein